MIRSKDFYLQRFATLEDAAHHLRVPVYRLRQLIRMGIIASDKHEKFVSWEQLNSYERIRFHHATHEQSKPPAKRDSVPRPGSHVRPD